MTTQHTSEIMKQAGIRATAIRVLVYKAIAELHDTFSLAELESYLPTVDRSSIFRTLNLFHEHQLLHSVDDGSGSVRYCMCNNLGRCKRDEIHAHFHCEVCNKTYCLEKIPIPQFVMPESYVVKEVNFVMKGICAKCSLKHKSL